MSNVPQVFADLDALVQAGVGSTFTKTPIGWDVKWVDGGTVIFIQGPTITEALAGYGMQISHPVKAVPQGIVEVELPPLETVEEAAARVAEERRAADQEAAMVKAFIEDKLPEEDRRSE